MEIQQAYETLSDIKTKRATINSKQQNSNQEEQQTNDHEELWSRNEYHLLGNLSK